MRSGVYSLLMAEMTIYDSLICFCLLIISLDYAFTAYQYLTMFHTITAVQHQGRKITNKSHTNVLAFERMMTSLG